MELEELASNCDSDSGRPLVPGHASEPFRASVSSIMGMEISTLQSNGMSEIT